MDLDVHPALSERAGIGISPDPASLIRGHVDGYAVNANIIGVNRLGIDPYQAEVIDPFNIHITQIGVDETAVSRIVQPGEWSFGNDLNRPLIRIGIQSANDNIIGLNMIGGNLLQRNESVGIGHARPVVIGINQ